MVVQCILLAGFIVVVTLVMTLVLADVMVETVKVFVVVTERRINLVVAILAIQIQLIHVSEYVVQMKKVVIRMAVDIVRRSVVCVIHVRENIVLVMHVIRI